MKIKKIILLSIICTLGAMGLAACSNPEGEAKIAQLKAENAELENRAESLQKTLDSMKVQTDSLRAVLKNLDMAP